MSLPWRHRPCSTSRPPGRSPDRRNGATSPMASALRSSLRGGNRRRDACGLHDRGVHPSPDPQACVSGDPGSHRATTGGDRSPHSQRHGRLAHSIVPMKSFKSVETIRGDTICGWRASQASGSEPNDDAEAREISALSGVENDSCKIPDGSLNALTNKGLSSVQYVGFSVPNFERECQKSTFCITSRVLFRAD